MDFNIEMRLKQLQSLENFICYSRDKVQSILDCLQWNVKDTVKESSLIKCSLDNNHRIPINSVEAHTQKCSLRKEGYDVSEDFLSEPPDNTRSSIHINDHMKRDILSTAQDTFPDFKSGWNGQDSDPQTSDRLLSTFSPDERLAFYNHAIRNTTGPAVLPEFNISQPVNNEGKVETEEELLKKERDAKRRRIKYKSVHTNHKSYMEIIREVIHGQMELYSEWVTGIKTEEGIDIKTGSMTTLEDTDRYSTNYAESMGKYSACSGSSSSAKYNGDTYSRNHNYEYSYNSYHYDSSNYSSRNEKSYNDSHRSHKYNERHHDRKSNGSYRRHRSRSRSTERHKSRRHHRSRSPHSRHRRYSSGHR